MIIPQTFLYRSLRVHDGLCFQVAIVNKPVYISQRLITSLAKGGYVFGSVGLSVCLVCLFVCEQHYSKSYERIGMKFYGQVLSSASKN